MRATCPDRRRWAGLSKRVTLSGMYPDMSVLVEMMSRMVEASLAVAEELLAQSDGRWATYQQLERMSRFVKPIPFVPGALVVSPDDCWATAYQLETTPVKADLFVADE